MRKAETETDGEAGTDPNWDRERKMVRDPKVGRQAQGTRERRDTGGGVETTER